MTLILTPMVGGVFAILMTLLSLQVSLRRVALRAELGDAEDEVLRRRIRAHGNFCEYAPLGLLLLGLLEYNLGANLALILLALILVATRLLHAYGILYAPRTKAKFFAMVTQHGLFLMAGCWLIYLAIMACLRIKGM